MKTRTERRYAREQTVGVSRFRASAPRATVAGMPSYLVESYLSRSQGHDLSELAQQARAAALALERQGKLVRYVRSSFVPEDEVCLHWFEAPSAALVDEATQLARLGCDRIVETLE